MTKTELGCFAEATTPESLTPIWLHDGASLVTYWDEGLGARRMPWQVGPAAEQYYGQQENLIRPSQFRRLHLNQWSQGEEAFVPIEWWDDCQEDVPELDGKTRVVIGVDGAVSQDSFAIVGVTRHWEAGRHQDIAVRFWGVWEPRAGKIDTRAIHDELARLIRTYNVVQVAFDPFQLDFFMSSLRELAPVWTEEFNQGADRNVADKTLFDLIRDRRIAHCGPAEVRQHLLNANVRTTDESKMRIEKRSTRMKVDLAVALSMAVKRCLYLIL